MNTTKNKGGRPRKRPSESELAALYAEHTTTEIAAMYDVSYWTVNNWVQFYRRNRNKKEYLMMACSSNDLNMKKVAITPFDISVLDAVYTLFQRGEQYFTIESLQHKLEMQERDIKSRESFVESQFAKIRDRERALQLPEAELESKIQQRINRALEQNNNLYRMYFLMLCNERWTGTAWKPYRRKRRCRRYAAPSVFT